KVGYGRINACQAVLLALAYDNRSTISAAMAYNSPRILARRKNSSSTSLLINFSNFNHYNNSTSNCDHYANYPVQLSMHFFPQVTYFLIQNSVF
ncbi:MAG: hypothetical protein JSW07_20390, partial [bacterium]